ncbi:PREDICTED: uncharacterized protein LOC104605810 isoform X2 [Nelumbo nucifera]|uniref:Uncharacterized protein LOC104605810 isoform X1 n=1 Tax=Nelumbo nucifera TaxID=4432 RepID=A0A1U8Q7G9_NELNU|nr:PREDICTED: uncharacterized protein LOC104605810 isoform X1 [Nelumbo nucifera]XP_019054728.1 PREDICTED: uncharacterized protein LOC104605810 isoform X2 [Nelumbo nucifera]
MEGEEAFTRDSMCSTKFEDDIDDTSNRSSSESAILCSESCIHLESMDKKEISGSGQPSFWDQQIPSRKRSKIRRSSTSLIEILRRDLIYTKQEKELCYLSESSEDLLIYKREDARFSNEIGLGTVLLNHRPLSFKEEYESSSIVMKNMVSSLNDTNMSPSSSSSSSSSCLYYTISK